VQHRYDEVEEAALHGQGRDLRPIGVLMAVAALTLASLPPLGPFHGRAVVEDAALAAGYGWVAPLLAIVAALVAGTLLRAAVRIFTGRGRRAPREATDSGQRETERERGDLPATSGPLLWGPAVVLLAASLAWGLLPGLESAAGRAAAAFVDSAGYRGIVLMGAEGGLPPPPAGLQAPGATAYLYAAASLLGALVVALIPLRAAAPPHVIGSRLLAGLRALHSGRPGDYAAWTVVGTALLAASFTLLLG
jgi:multicomponent Na+:H+ antiporter subunit D